MDYKAKKILEAGDMLPVKELLAAAATCDDPFGSLTILDVDGTKVSMEYTWLDGDIKKVIPYEWDVKNGPLQLGRKMDPASNNYPLFDQGVITDDYAVKRYKAMSGLQASIVQDPADGEIKYRHDSKNKVLNPLYDRLENQEIKAIPAEAGNGGGFTHENAKGNPRASNEDVGLGHRGPAVNAVTGTTFLKKLIERDIVPATRDHPAGSTLSLAMRTRDGNVACAFLGDSPIFAVARNSADGEIRLMQLNMPHNLLGRETQKLFNAGVVARPAVQNLGAMIEALEQSTNQTALTNAELFRAEYPHPDLRALSKSLGKMGVNTSHLKREDMDEDDWSRLQQKHTPECFSFNPALECPKGWEFKGTLVCSDGIDKGVSRGAVQQALRELYDKNATPAPEQVSETAVRAAQSHTRDNITAMMLPSVGPAGDLVMVADGNTGSVEVARTAANLTRQRCEEIAHTARRAEEWFEEATITQRGNAWTITPREQNASASTKQLLLQQITRLVEDIDLEGDYQVGKSITGNILKINNPSPSLRTFLQNQSRDQSLAL